MWTKRTDTMQIKNLIYFKVGWLTKKPPSLDKTTTEDVAQAWRSPNEAVVRTPWPLGNDIQQSHVGIIDSLYVYRVTFLSDAPPSLK